MDKKTLVRRLTSFCNGAEMITPEKVKMFTGLGRNRVMDTLEGLDFLMSDGGVRHYFIPDVAERIMERSRRSGV